MKNIEQISIETPYWKHLIKKIVRHRFIKFGMVGASGTLVNLIVLTLCHECIFSSIEPKGSRPYFSLIVAIVISTFSNFSLNRYWTWSDRRRLHRQEIGIALSNSLTKDFAKYFTASGVGIVLQYILTLLLTGFFEYRIANLIAIVIASVSNFLINDHWTFKHRKNQHDHIS